METTNRLICYRISY